MQCMMMMSANVILMGGHQPILVEMDLETRREIRQVIKIYANTGHNKYIIHRHHITSFDALYCFF
jgi:anti-anti-sigma regulatory factor